MPSVDERIVSMKMDNKQFESGATRAVSLLDRLKSALRLDGAGKGLSDVQNSANKFNLQGLASAATGIGSKFSAMSVVAVAALATITAKAVSAGLRIGSALTLKPMKAGFDEYELKMGSIQTILSNTARYGTKLPEVTRNLDQLNAYADKTIYNFGDMTKNIGLFTNAGIKIGDATSMIKGFSNEAAASGTNAQGAASAAYQLSQALSAGTIRLMDWRSLQNVGMGNKNMQNGLIELAESMGTLEKAGISAKSVQEDFNGSLEKKWLSADVMSKYLKIMAGDLSVAEQKSLGLSDAQIKMFKTQQKNAEDAATKVRTFTQLTGTIAESIGSGWAETFNLLIGDFNQATDLWTGVNNTLGKMIGKWGDARNALIKGWAKNGGRTALLDSFENIFKAVLAIAKPIKEAFREIFPATTGKQLADLTKRFRDFTENLKIGAGTAGLVKRSFAGFFAIFSIGWSLVKALASVLGDLFGVVMDGSGSFLEVTAGIGDWLVALDKAIKKGDVFGKFFDSLKSLLGPPVALLKVLGAAVVDMFKSFKANGLAGLDGALGRLTDRFAPLTTLAKSAGGAWTWLFGILQKTGQFLAPLGEAIGTALAGIGGAIAKAFKDGDFSSVFDALNTGLLTGIVLLIKKFLSNGLKIDIGNGLGASIKETFGALTDTLSAMQAQIQAKTLMTIAAAIGILVISIVALSLIDSGKLTKALTAMGVAFGQLMLAMSILTKIAGAGGFAKIPVIAAGMILLAAAVLILTAAVRNLSGLSWEELLKGLVGVGALLTMISVVANGLQKSSGAILRVGLAMIPLAIGLKILASALGDVSGMSWGEIAKGLVAIGGAMLIMALGLKFMSGTMSGAAAMIVAAAAINIMVPALQAMGRLKWQEIGKIMVTLFGALLLLAAGMYAMTASLPGAAALIVAAAAIAILTPSLVALGELDWASIGKIMVVLFGGLLILAAGLTAMIAALPGAAALLVAASALAILAPVMILLGTMSWEMIGKGLVAIAGAILAIGIAAILLAPAVPVIMGLGVAFLLLGASMALIGTGLLAIATAFGIFVAAGTAGIAVLIGMINLIPLFMTKMAEGIGAFAVAIVGQSGKLVNAFVSLLNSILTAIIVTAPKIGKAFNVLMATALSVVSANIPKIVNVAIKLMLAFITALTNKMPQLVNAATKLIVAFLSQLSKNVPKIAKVGTDLIIKLMSAISQSQGRLLNAGARMIIDFINKLANTIRSHQGEMRAAGRNLGSAIISGMTGGMSASSVISRAVSVARSAIAAAKRALGVNSPAKTFIPIGNAIPEGWALGIDRAAHFVTDSVDNIAGLSISAAEESTSKIAEAFAMNVETSPTIAPVLDLSSVLSDAQQISKALEQTPIKTTFTLSAANDISNSVNNRNAGPDDKPEGSGNVYLDYKQYNTSPESLSAADIYRNTKSSLAVAREVLKV